MKWLKFNIKGRSKRRTSAIYGGRAVYRNSEGKGTWRFFNQYCHAGGKNGKKSTRQVAENNYKKYGLKQYITLTGLKRQDRDLSISSLQMHGCMTFWGYPERKKKITENLDIGRGQKVMVEFVSANPTGPLHMAMPEAERWEIVLPVFLRKPDMMWPGVLYQWCRKPDWKIRHFAWSKVYSAFEGRGCRRVPGRWLPWRGYYWPYEGVYWRKRGQSALRWQWRKAQTLLNMLCRKILNG